MTATDDILDAARERAGVAAAAAPRPDYAAVNIVFRKQRTALTRAINSGDKERIRSTVIAHVRAWREPPFNGFWPDAWARWQVALDDTLGWNDSIDLSDLR